MKNKEIADLLYQIADLLEMQEVPFKPRAYRKVAQMLESMPEAVEDIYKKGGLKALDDLPGVGKGISEKIEEALKNGRIKSLEKLKKKIPVDVESLGEVEGLGPKRMKLLYQKLKIKNLSQLEKAAKAGRISKVPSLGKKVEQNILKNLEFTKKGKKRVLLGLVYADLKRFERKVNSLKGVDEAVIAGSVRRMRETIKDVDMLAISSKPKVVMDAFVKMDEVQQVIAKGTTKATVRLKNNLKCDLRVLEKKSFGAGLHYFTGSKQHNIALRRIAIKKGYKFSEYGLFKGKKMLPAYTEEQIYKKLGLPFIEPELRENRGEIEAAKAHKLPSLVKLKDIKGDLHMHTKSSDGTFTIEEMVGAAKKLGREYVAITDHTGFLKVAGGMDASQILAQKRKIDKLNKKQRGFSILSGVEVNIDGKGNPDIKDDVLKKLDVVVASIHTGFKETKEKMTSRIIKAMENPNVDIIAHPRGRIIQKRESYAVNFDAVLRKAKETGTALEINAFPSRLDLQDEDILKAVKQKVKLVVSTDAHATDHLSFMEFGVAQARRGWASKKDILNTRSVGKFLDALKS